MRDFKAGRDIHVQGDIHILDNSAQPKMLVACTNEELLEQRIHRCTLLKREVKSKWKRLAMLWVFFAVAVIIASVWLYLIGNTGLATLIVSFGPIAVGLASVKVLENPPEFEVRQRSALREIALILRERGFDQ